MFMESPMTGKHTMVRFLVSASRREVSIYCSVQVVRIAPFKCPSVYLSRPLHLPVQEFPDGSAHLLFTDPNMGASIMVPTLLRTSSALPFTPAPMGGF